MQFWRDIVCVMVETLLSGTQGEKAHLVYKEEDGIHFRLAYEFYFDVCLDFFSRSCLAKIAGVV